MLIARLDYPAAHPGTLSTVKSFIDRRSKAYLGFHKSLAQSMLHLRMADIWGNFASKGHRCDDVDSCNKNTEGHPSIGYMMLELDFREIGESKEVGAEIVVDKVTVPESGGTNRRRIASRPTTVRSPYYWSSRLEGRIREWSRG